jgi:hypothetical protein
MCGFELIEPKKPDAIMRVPSRITFFALKVSERPAYLCHCYPRGKNICCQKIKIFLDQSGTARVIGGNGYNKKIKASVQKASTPEEALKKVIIFFINS